MLLFAVNDNGCCVTNGKAVAGSLDDGCTFGPAAFAINIGVG